LRDTFGISDPVSATDTFKLVFAHRIDEINHFAATLLSAPPNGVPPGPPLPLRLARVPSRSTGGPTRPRSPR
jgi:hypothetical protein